MKKILLLSLLSLFSTTIFAQNFSAQVVDPIGEPLVYANVYNKQKTKHTHTNDEGYFELDMASKGDTLYISQVGFESKNFVLPAIRDNIKITLNRKSFELSRVVIKKNMSALNLFSDVNVKTAPLNNAQEVLLKVPGLMIGQHAGGGKAEQIFLRGFDIDHGTDVGITVENMPVNMVSHAHGQGYADMHFVIPETIDQINFGKGPYDANKGNFATAGYVDLKLKNKLDNNLLKIEGGQFNTKRILGMFNLLNDDKQQAYIATEYNSTDGPFENSQNFSRSNFMARYNAQIDPSNSLTLSASHFTSSWDASGQIPQRSVDNGSISRFGAIDPTEGGQTSRSNLWLSHTKLLNESSYVKSNLYYSTYDFELFSNFTFFLDDSINGDQIRQYEDRALWGGQVEYGKEMNVFNHKTSLETGVSFRNDESKDNELSHTKNRLTTLEQYQYGDINETNLAAYVNAEFEIGNFLVQSGVRVDHFRFGYINKLSPTYSSLSNNDAALSPKLNILYNYNPNLQFYLKTGKGFHSNDSRVVLNQSVRKNLPAAYGTDVGFIWKAHKNFFINVAAWQLYLEQEFVYVGDAGIVEPSGETSRKGIDLSMRYQPKPWLFMSADINYAHARALETDEGANYIPLAPEITALANLQLLHPSGWFGGLRVRHMGNRSANEDNTLVAKGYTVTDGNAGYNFGKLECGINIKNVFNVAWNETQFATESRLKNEPLAVEEIHFTPGTPFNASAYVSFKF